VLITSRATAWLPPWQQGSETKRVNLTLAAASRWAATSAPAAWRAT